MKSQSLSGITPALRTYFDCRVETLIVVLLNPNSRFHVVTKLEGCDKASDSIQSLGFRNFDPNTLYLKP